MDGSQNLNISCVNVEDHVQGVPNLQNNNLINEELQILDTLFYSKHSKLLRSSIPSIFNSYLRKEKNRKVLTHLPRIDSESWTKCAPLQFFRLASHKGGNIWS